MLTRTHRFLPTSLTFFTGALSCVVTVFTAVFSCVPSLPVCVVVKTVVPPLGTVVPGVVPVVPVVVRLAPVLVGVGAEHAVQGCAAPSGPAQLVQEMTDRPKLAGRGRVVFLRTGRLFANVRSGGETASYLPEASYVGILPSRRVSVRLHAQRNRPQFCRKHVTNAPTV